MDILSTIENLALRPVIDADAGSGAGSLAAAGLTYNSESLAPVQ